MAFPCYEPKAQSDFTLISKSRKLVGEEGVEELLAKTITVAVEIGLIKPEELKKLVVDSTVMPKAIAHPTDSKLLETSRDKLVEVAKAVKGYVAPCSSQLMKHFP